MWWDNIQISDMSPFQKEAEMTLSEKNKNEGSLFLSNGDFKRGSGKNVLRRHQCEDESGMEWDKGSLQQLWVMEEKEGGGEGRIEQE